MLADSDGGGAREILKPKPGTSYREVSWMPDGSIVAAKLVSRGKKFGYRDERSVVTMNLDGSDERTVFRLRYHLQGNLQEDLSTYFLPIELSPSPDGQRLLVTIQNGYRNDGRRLEVVSMVDGSRTLIAKKSYSGSWSPDGQSIVFASDRTGNGEVCPVDDGCRTAGDIFIADADGGNQRPLLSTRAEEANPAWSPDGERILFSGTRNHPREEFASEIYSVRPDGTCLTWLTNGSPASITPAWGRGGTSDPGGCGAGDRRPLVEGGPKTPKRGPLRSALWLGPRVRESLYSGSFGIFGVSIIDYEDCSTFNPAACTPPVSLMAVSTCSLRGSWAESLRTPSPPGSRSLWRRGVRVIQERVDGSPMTAVFSGGAITFIGPSPFGDPGVDGLSFAEQLPLVARLRPLGSASAGGKLPRVLIPAQDIRLARKVTRVFQRSGSVRETAKRLNMARDEVLDNLAFKRGARWLGGVKSIGCPSGKSPLEGLALRSMLPGSMLAD
jgi:TolB protein